MILYQHVSCFQNFLNFLAANGFSIGGKQPPSTVGHQGDHRQIGCKVALGTRSRLDGGANHSLDSQSPQVCSPCLSELGAVCARLVSQTANIPKRSDAVSGGHSDRARSSTSTRPGGRRMSNVETFGEWLGSRVWHQHLAEMLQHTSDTRTSREMSISTKMSSPDCSPVRAQALKWSRVLWPYKLAISNWSAMTTTKLLSVSLQLFRQTNVLRCGASTTFWCSPPWMRLLAVSLVGSQH